MAETQSQETQISAGEQLKHLREQKNLSVQGIASRLNLETRIIEAIEDNDFELLPVATYTRGYLRSYAKIVGIDPEAVVSSYNDGAPGPPEIIPEIKHPTQTSSSDKPVRVFTYLVTLTLVILLVAWLYSNFVVDEMSSGNASSIEAIEGVPAALSNEPLNIEDSTPPAFEATDPETDIFSETGTELIIDSESDPNLDPDLDSNLDANPVSDPDSVQDPESDADTASELDLDLDGDLAYSLIVTTDNEGPDSLIMRITTESWIEVYDSLENRVFVNLARQGQVLYLKGTAPFKILLGFAEGVSVEINGELFDTAPYTKSSIARFSLDR